MTSRIGSCLPAEKPASRWRNRSETCPMNLFLGAGGGPNGDRELAQAQTPACNWAWRGGHGTDPRRQIKEGEYT